MNIATKPTLVAVAEGASPLDVLAARHRAAWDKTQHGRQEWIEGTLELAAVLAEERKHFKANQDFSRWLARNSLAEIKEHDREALIKMATNPAVAREVLEKTDRWSWREIWTHELRPRYAGTGGTRQTPAKRKSKTERRTIEQVLNLHCTRGFTFDETAEELGLTKGMVAGIVRRNGSNSKPAAAAPRPKRWEGPGLDSKTLTRKQVDPDFKGTDLEFAAKYGHVPLQTKTEIEENQRQQVLSQWLAAVTTHQQSARALAEIEAPNPDTLRQWLAKPSKAERLQAWLTAIEAAYHSIDSIVPSLAVVGK